MSNAQAIASLHAFSAGLRKLASQETAIKVAAAAAPALTAAIQATFNAGEDAYGIGWVPKEDGTRATLKKSGALASKLHYVAIGTKLRVALGVRYAKYVVGKRPVTPRQGDPLPAAYSEAIARAAVAVCKAELGR